MPGAKTAGRSRILDSMLDSQPQRAHSPYIISVCSPLGVSFHPHFHLSSTYERMDSRVHHPIFMKFRTL
jgi:hypothetical protein